MKKSHMHREKMRQIKTILICLLVMQLLVKQNQMKEEFICHMVPLLLGMREQERLLLVELQMQLDSAM